MKTLHFVFLFFQVFVASFLHGQSIINGEVIHDGKPLNNAQIYNSKDLLVAVTNEFGQYQFVVDSLPFPILVTHIFHPNKTDTLTNSNFRIIKVENFENTAVEVVVTGYRIPIRAGQLTKLNSFLFTKALQRNHSADISPILNQVPGIYMHSGALNTSRLTIRGIGSRSLFSTNKVRAYLNEIPLTNGDGETTIEDIDLNLIQEIAVVKGPASSLYGAGLGGSILLNTNSKQLEAPKTEAITSALIGAFGMLSNSLKFQHKTADSDVKLAYQRVHRDGYRENSQYNRDNLTALGTFNHKNGSTTFLAGFTKLKGFIPSSLSLEDFRSNPKQAAFSWAQTKGFESYSRGRLGVSHSALLSKHISNKTSIFTSFKNAYELRPFNILTENTNEIGVRTLFKSGFSLFKKQFQAMIGGEYYIDWNNWQTFENQNGISGNTLSNNSEQRNHFNTFAQLGAQIEGFVFTIGGNLNQSRFLLDDRLKPNGIDQSGNYHYQPVFSPRLSIRHQFRKYLTWEVIVSHGFSIPQLQETLTPDGIVNPNIRPESGYNFELGIWGKVLKDKLDYKVNIYSMHIQNLLVAKRIGEDQYTGINAGKTIHNGIETEFEYSIYDSKKWQIDCWLNHTFSHYRFAEFVDDNNGDFSGNFLTGVPANILNVGIDVNSKFGIYGNLNFNFTDRAPLRDDNSIYSDAYALLNAKLGYKTNFRRFAINGFILANNLLNEQYASMLLINAGSFGGKAPRYYYPGNPRNLLLGISIGYLIR